MPLFIEEGRNPIPWVGDKYLRPSKSACSSRGAAEVLRIALVNNMPDSALEDTEEQFFRLLDGASDGRLIDIKPFSLTNILRGERAQQHLDNFYSSSAELLNQRFDGVIITGTEPKQPDLRNEPYWGSLTKVFDWAEENSYSTVLSCLAAHAGTLHSDGIARTPVGEKRFGVFTHQKLADHFLTAGTTDKIRIPHSRWNELREDALVSSGYTVVTRADKAGVDLFVKEKKNSLFVHFQGHPEYLALTLFKEYRRDVRRYLRQERDAYPQIPEGYFDAEATRQMDDFRAKALVQPHEGSMDSFPEAAIVKSLRHSWRASAGQIYQNWLQYLSSRKTGAAESTVMARAGQS